MDVYCRTCGHHWSNHGDNNVCYGVVSTPVDILTCECVEPHAIEVDLAYAWIDLLDARVLLEVPA